MTSIPWNRINTGLLLFVLLGMIAMFATRTYGGPLDPPGAPDSTDGVREPGTPISAIPFTITQPGRYYLTRTLTGASAQNGITIQASRVTLDLHGFALIGVAGSVSGVLVSGPQRNVRIENGTVRSWFNGIDASTSSDSRISNVIAFFNGVDFNDGSYGILIGSDSVIEDCIVNSNANHGVLLGGRSVIRRCTISLNNGHGVVATTRTLVESNRIESNAFAVGYAGIYVLGSNVIIRDNSLSQARDILLEVNPSSLYTLAIDNTLNNCTSIVNGGLQNSNIHPLNGIEHSNVVEGVGYC